MEESHSDVCVCVRVCCVICVACVCVCVHVQGCQLLIALTHMRIPNDVRLAKEVQELDLVLGGHDHHYEKRQASLEKGIWECEELGTWGGGGGLEWNRWHFVGI